MAIVVKLAVDDKANAKIIELSKNTDKFKSRAQELDGVMKKAFAFAGVIFGISQLTAGFKASAAEALKFEQAMSRIKGIGEITGGALKQTSNLAKELAKNTEFSASTIANAMLEVVKMGFKADALKNTMPAMLDLASAAMMDLNYAVTNTIGTMNQFGMDKSIESVTRATNVMATVLNATGSDAEDFMESMKYAGAVAKETGMSFEETAAMIGILADAGIRGTQAGTTLRSMFIRFMQPTGKVKEGLKSLGIEGKTLSEILVGLKNNGLNVIDFLDTFDRTAITGTMVLADEENSKKLKALNIDLLAQATNVKDVASLVRDNLTVSFQKLVNNLNIVTISLFDAFGDRPKSAIEGVTEAVQSLDVWVQNNQDDIKKFADNVGDMIEGFAKLASVITTTLLDNLDRLVIIFAAMNVKYLPALVTNFSGLFGTLGAFDPATKKVLEFNSGIGTIKQKSDIAATSLQGMASALNAGVIAGTALSIAIDAIFKAWNEMMDQNMKNVQIQTTEEGLKTQLELVTKIKDIHAEIASLTKDRTEHDWLWSKDKRDVEIMSDLLRQRTELEKEFSSKYGGAGAYGTMAGNETAATQTWMNLNARYQAMKNKKPELTMPDASKFNPITDTEGKKGRASPPLGVRYSYEKPSLDNEKATDALADHYYELNQLRKKWATDAETDELERQKKANDDLLKAQEEANYMMLDSYWSLGDSITSVYETIAMKKLQTVIDAAEKEKAIIDEKFNAEIRMASGSAFKREMLEQRRTKAVIEADKKIAAAKAAMDKKQRVIDNARATADMFRAIVGTIAETEGNAAVRIASGAIIAGIVGSYVAQLVAINYREGSGGVFQGRGNGTSDSIMARVSKGERVLSTSEIDSLGGNDRIQQAIDRGVHYNNSGDTTVIVENVIGTKQFLRDHLLPDIKRELRR